MRLRRMHTHTQREEHPEEVTERKRKHVEDAGRGGRHVFNKRDSAGARRGGVYLQGGDFGAVALRRRSVERLRLLQADQRRAPRWGLYCATRLPACKVSQRSSPHCI